MKKNVSLKILLINPEDIKRQKRIFELNPFAGLAYIASFLDNKFRKFVDCTIIEMLPQQMTINSVLEVIKKEQYSVCGITSKTYNFNYAIKLAIEIKKQFPDTIVIFGGAHATALPKEVIRQNSIDAVITHEGELVFQEIINNILSGVHPFENVEGVWFKSSGEVIFNGLAKLINNLETIPFIDWDKYYDLNKYDRYYDNQKGKFLLMLPIFASRGCPYGCHFCQPVLTRKYRTRPVANVIDEIMFLQDKYKIERIYFDDSIFGIKKKWFLEFCSEYIDSGLSQVVNWGFETNVNCIDEEMMTAASDAGCVYVYFGMESASDKVLKHIGKGASKEKLKNAIDYSKKAGIFEVSGSFIFGMPYETAETANETLEFIKNSSLDTININLLDVYPGTKLYNMVDKGVGGIKWIHGKKDKWDSCGRTIVKTYVNDLDSIEKLENIFKRALAILHKKFRKNYFMYFRRIAKYIFYYSLHNPTKLKKTIMKSLNAYFPRVSKLQ